MVNTVYDHTNDLLTTIWAGRQLSHYAG